MKMRCYQLCSFTILDCHATLTESQGDVISYGYPQGYYNYMQCTWLIQRPLGEVIEMKVLDFDIEPDYNNHICV